MQEVKRLVVKVGSSTLTYENGALNLRCIEGLVRQLSDIHNRGIDVVLVTSGAIAAGVGRLGLKERPKSMPEKQSAAAVGQVTLMHMYDKIFAEYGKITAQILITRDDMDHNERFTNAQNTFFALFKDKIIPIVNENDAIATEEIKFGDNDTLSAVVCKLVKADLLIIMSDIDGLYDYNPSVNPKAELISYVGEITKEIEDCAGGAGTSLGTGGMITKLNAAKIAMDSGASMLIVNGALHNVLNKVLDGEEFGTLFRKGGKYGC